MARPKQDRPEPQLREYRLRAHLTQEEVAATIGANAELVRKHERGLARPTEHYRKRYCELYKADEVQLGLRAPERVSAEAEEIVDVLARVRRLETSRIGTDMLIGLGLAVEDIVDRYERVGPAQLIRPLTDQRKALDKLIDDCRSCAQRQQLLRLAGQTSALLGYLAVNRERYPLGRAYCAEAIHLADYAEDPELLAWIKGTQSFCEYYAGDFQRAVDFAREGLAVAGDGPQAVRLAINGEARALGKLGDVAGVHVAVERGYALTDRLPEVPGVSPCISLGGYSLARTASNAVTAYVDLGLPDEVARHAEIALPEFEASDSQWSQSLIRLDLANSMAAAKDSDPEEASSLVDQALNISADKPITSVLQRSRAFVRATGKWRGVRAVEEVHQAVAAARLR